jgi:hypothetical protein
VVNAGKSSTVVKPRVIENYIEIHIRRVTKIGR